MDAKIASLLQEDDDNEYAQIQLLQLDPEPVEFANQEEEDKFERDTLQNTPLLPSWVNPFGLSSGGGAAKRRGSSTYYLTKLQKYSSYAFTVFASFHITNTSLIPLLTRSVPASEKYLLLTRPYYQSFPLEPLLISLPIAIHVTSGIALRLRQRNINLFRYGAIYLPITTRLEKGLKVWPPISWTSVAGYLLIPLVGSHVTINRIIPWYHDGGSSGVGLGYVAHSFAKHPTLASISYVAMIGLATGHFCWGFCRWNKLIIPGKSRKARQRWWTINGISVALAMVWIAGGLGVIGRGGRAAGWIGKGYDNLLQHIYL